MPRPLARRRTDDRGQTLVLVVLVTVMVMVLAATSVSITASNIAPARRTADTQAAFAAAQGGVDEFGLQLAICDIDYEIADCPSIYGTGQHDLVGVDGATRATYAWDLSETPDDERGVFRVTSTGRVNGVERSLVADYRPTPSFLDFLYFTERETLSPDLVQRYYGPRTVQIPTLYTLPNPDRSSITWSGAQGASICAETWYDSPFAPGRSTLKTLQGYEWRETSNAPVITRNGGCDVVFITGMTFEGKVYSKDAFLFSNGTTGGLGPMFRQPIRTEWRTNKVPAPPVPKFYRSVPNPPGGDPYAGWEVPKVAAGSMSMPEGIDDVEDEATCVFTGPTRIKLVGATAVVTSPQTTLGMLKPGYVPGAGSGFIGSGLVQVPIPITNTTSFYVKNTTPVAVATPTNPVFDIRNVTAPTVGSQPATFYTEMNTPAMPVNLTTMRAAAASGPLATPVFTTLNAWLAQVNAQSNALRAVGATAPQYRAITAAAAAAPTDDPLLEKASQATMVQRGTCTLNAAKACTVPVVTWTNAFTLTRASYTFPLSNDVTPYYTGLGNAFLEGNLTGMLTIAAENNVVITENTTYNGTPAVPTGTLGLVADRYVEIYHPVSCVTTYTAATTAGHCPDDLTGLYSAWSDTNHPSRRYTNIRGTDLNDMEIDAAILARLGSFTLQNYLRGIPMGTNTVTGGVYQQHRGPTGVSWDSVSTAHRSGYTTSMTYDPRLELYPPPNFVKPSEALTNSAWLLLGISGQEGG